jgi:NAD(P)-dependent dehydrogenase (short-subunit alcohol dehydrogenase family)
MKDGGVIINISSLAAQIGMAGYGAYNASKAGQSALTRTAAIELGHRGIRVVDICPATVATENLSSEKNAAAEAAVCSRLTPLKRICEMDEVAATVHFLAADDCRYITGTSILLDGGMRAGISTGLGELLLQGLE